MAENSFLDFGTIIEVVSGVANSVKSREDGESGLSLDYQKLGLVLAGIAGRRVIGWVMENRQSRKNIIDAEVVASGKKADKKKSRIVPTLVIGAVTGAAGYLLTMKPEQRAALFQNIDQFINDVIGFVNELQGKPYSRDFEVKSGS